MDIQVKHPHQSSRYWRSISAIFLMAIPCLIQSCEARTKYGAATPDRLVEQYLVALEERNLPAMLQLMPEKSIATAEFKAKIARLGGYNIREHQVTYIKPKPTLWNANIRGSYLDRSGVSQKFADSIVLSYQSKGNLKLYAGNWYLVP